MAAIKEKFDSFDKGTRPAIISRLKEISNDLTEPLELFTYHHESILLGTTISEGDAMLCLLPNQKMGSYDVKTSSPKDIPHPPYNIGYVVNNMGLSDLRKIVNALAKKDYK